MGIRSGLGATAIVVVLVVLAAAVGAQQGRSTGRPETPRTSADAVPLPLVSVPLAKASADMIYEDLVRACAVQTRGHFKYWVSEGKTEAKSKARTLEELIMASDAAEHGLYAGVEDEAFGDCIYKRRRAQMAGAPLRVSPEGRKAPGGH